VCYDSVSSGRGIFSELQFGRTGKMLTEEDLIKNGKELPECRVSLKINYYVIQFLPHTKRILFPLDRTTRKSC